MDGHPTESLAVSLFGQFALCLSADAVTEVARRKSDWLLARLIVEPGHVVLSELLVQELWPEELNQNCLHQSVAHLRHLLGCQANRLWTSRGKVALDLSGANVDLMAFAALANDEEADRLEDAMALYERGPLLQSWEQNNERWKEAGPWVQRERAKLKARYLHTAQRLAKTRLEGGQPEKAIPALRVCAAVGRDEEAWCSYMECLVVTGRRLEAVRAYETCRDYFQKSGLGPPDCMTRLLRGLQQGSSMPAPIHEVAEPGEGAAELETPGGAMRLDSRCYIVRTADEEVRQAIARRDSIILIKGPRETGKSSLLARAAQQAREQGAAVAMTDFLRLSETQAASKESLMRAMMQSLADHLDLPVTPAEAWSADRDANDNLERYLLREVLARIQKPLVWCMDEVDRLLTCSFRNDVLSLFRSWHNARSLDPEGAWSRLTLAMAYATEAHLLIADLNTSPFNVGTRVILDDFDENRIAEMNARLGEPLRNAAELAEFADYLGGNPSLVHLGLHEMALHSTTWAELREQAERDGDCFRYHLERFKSDLKLDPELHEAILGMLEGRACPGETTFYRLRTAGLISGPSVQSARFRCALYRRYLEAHLR